MKKLSNSNKPTKDKKTVDELYKLVDKVLYDELNSSKEYKKINEKKDKIEDFIKDILTGKDYKEFSKLVEYEADIECLIMELGFKRGFAMATQLFRES